MRDIFGRFIVPELEQQMREQIERERLAKLPNNALLNSAGPGAGSPHPWQRRSPFTFDPSQAVPFVEPPMPFVPGPSGPAGFPARPMPQRPYPNAALDSGQLLMPGPYYFDPHQRIDPREFVKPLPHYIDPRIDPTDAVQLFGNEENGDTFGDANRQVTSVADSVSAFPFRRDNRRPDGTWIADDATEDNIEGTSIDRYEPVWPRWKKTPPPDFEGEFISDQGFFDIDEITQTAKFYPPGTPLVDKNLDGNPASRQRVRDGLTGNLWRRRLLVAPSQQLQPGPDAPAWSLRSSDDGWATGKFSPQSLLSAASFGSHAVEDEFSPMTFSHQQLAGVAPTPTRPSGNSAIAQQQGQTKQQAPALPIRGSRSQNSIIYDHADGAKKPVKAER